MIILTPKSSSSGAPSGPAGGDLAGTYPNPTLIASIKPNIWELWDSGGFTSLSWQSRELITGGNPSLDWANSLLIDNFGATSLDWINRTIIDGDGTTSFDGANRTLNAGGSGVTTVGWSQAYLYDLGGVASILWADRSLSDSAGNPAFNWTNPAGVTISKIIANYNGLATAGVGASSIVGDVNLAAQTTTLGDTTIITPSSAGLFEINTYIECTSAGSAGTVAVQIKFSGVAGIGQTKNPIGGANISLTGLGTYDQGTMVIAAAAGSSIKYNTTVSGATGTPKYSLKIVVKKIQ